MKKQMILGLLLALLLCSCGQTEEISCYAEEPAPKATPEQLEQMETEQSAPMPVDEPMAPDQIMEEPGKLTILCGSSAAQAMSGSWSWWYDNGDGTQSGIEACGMHPLDGKDHLQMLTAEQAQATLQFDSRNPDKVTICSWSTEHWGDYEAKSEPVSVTDFTFLVEPDRVYEITAVWNTMTGCGGTAYYAFYTAF